MYRRHLESLRKKLTSRVALLRRLAGSGCGARATILRTATRALVLLRSESPSGKSAKLCTVAASNNKDYTPRSLCCCLIAPRIYSVFLCAHSVRGELRNPAQRQQSGCNSAFNRKVLHSCLVPPCSYPPYRRSHQ